MKSSVLGRKALQREKPQNSTMSKCCRSATFGLKGLINVEAVEIIFMLMRDDFLLLFSKRPQGLSMADCVQT